MSSCRVCALVPALALSMLAERASAQPPATPADTAAGVVVGVPALQVGGNEAQVRQADVGRTAAHRETTRRVTPLVAPIPGYNPQIGWVLGGIVGAIHRFGNDTVSPPSTAALLGFASTNGSWGVMAGELAHLDGDAWRPGVLGGYIDLRYDFYGIGSEAGAAGISVELEQPMTLVALQLLRRIASDWYLGARGIYAQVTMRPRVDDRVPEPLQPLFERERTFTSVALAPVLQFDSRDDQFYPTRGALLDAMAQLGSSALGGDSTYQAYTAMLSGYRNWHDGRDVLAALVHVCIAAGEVPIPMLCTVGGQDLLRGYEPGRYRDRSLVSAQVEWRRRIGRRFGVTAFGGAAEVAPKLAELTLDDVLPAAGVGARYRLTKAYTLNYRVDVAYGRDGWQYYFGIAEAF